jgi:hypothetical protein
MPVSMTEQVAEPASPARRRPQHLSLLVLGGAAVVAALVVAWLVLGSSSGTPAANGRPVIVSQAKLERFARTLDYPLYWAGPKPGFSYELTAASGRAWVRYLPAGVSAGDSRSDFLVVGTYKQPHSYANLQHAANRSGGVSRRIAGNGLLVYSAAKPTSVYFSFPGADYQVEVYTHSTKTARSLVLDGTIEPVHAVTAGYAQGVSGKTSACCR